MIDSLLNVFSGGATGLIGAGINLFAEHKKAKTAMEKADKDAENDRKMFELEAEHADRLSARVEDSKKEIEAVKLFGESIKADKATYSQGAAKALESLGMKSDTGWVGGFSLIMAILSLSALVMVDVARGLIRPVMTAYLVFMVADIGNEESKGALIYMGTTALFWWFGTRVIPRAKK